MSGKRWLAIAQGYCGGIVVTLLVVLGRLGMNPWWGVRSNRHLFFFPTVMLVSWFGGFGPGLVSAAISTVAIAYFWTARGSPQNAVPELTLFFVIATAIAMLIESLRKARARANAAARSREQLLAVVAHDLRNPLATIKLTLTALQENRGDEESVRRRLAVIDRSASRMDALIRDLVDATRMEHARVELALRDERVDSILRDAVEQFSALAREKGLEIRANPSVSALVKCDRERVLQVLGNLIGNALRFTPEGGRITLRTAQHDAEVRFEVEDDGPGIRPEDLAHIFERYWTSDRKGSGLGLFIAESIVRAHGGRIGVDSRLGAGARFFFTLPRTAAAEAAATVPSPAENVG
jgi:signal transduction histidine kinase